MFVAITVEVAVHRVYATLVLGWAAAFQYYLLLAALAWVVYRRVSARTRLALAISLCLGLVAMAAVFQGRPPSLVLHPLLISVFGVFNLAFVLIIALGVAPYVPWILDHARAQLKEAMQAGSYEL